MPLYKQHFVVRFLKRVDLTWKATVRGGLSKKSDFLFFKIVQSSDPLTTDVYLHHTHFPPLHVCPAGHTNPHLPQLLESVRRFTSQPFQLFWSQSPQPLEQVKVQSPLKHVAAAFGSDGQTDPHAPQLRESVCTFTQSAPHLTWPAVHASWLYAVSGQRRNGKERLKNNKKSLRRIWNLSLNIFPSFSW